MKTEQICQMELWFPDHISSQSHMFLTIKEDIRIRYARSDSNCKLSITVTAYETLTTKDKLVRKLGYASC